MLLPGEGHRVQTSASLIETGERIWNNELNKLWLALYGPELISLAV